jgi:hypothetical protein
MNGDDAASQYKCQQESGESVAQFGDQSTHQVWLPANLGESAQNVYDLNSFQAQTLLLVLR